jgi:hypothetical protein
MLAPAGWGAMIPPRHLDDPEATRPRCWFDHRRGRFTAAGRRKFQYTCADWALRAPAYRERSGSGRWWLIRRLRNYIDFIVPPFSRSHVNFRRVPLVDTSNPFIARDIPIAEESVVVIRFRDPRNHEFPITCAESKVPTCLAPTLW